MASVTVTPNTTRQCKGSCNVKNRIAHLLSESEQEAYEEWADQVFSLVFDNPEDVCTLTFGDRNPKLSGDLFDDFGCTMSKQQRIRYDAYVDQQKRN